MRIGRPAAAALLAAALAGGCRGPTPPAPRGPAPEFRLQGIEGGTVSLADFRGKVVLLDFWATYCLPCHESIPFFQRLYERHGGRGLEIVGVSVDAYAGHVPEFVRERGMTYVVALDPEQTTPALYGYRTLPTTFLLDREGRILRRWAGFDSAIAEEMEEEILAALQVS